MMGEIVDAIKKHDPKRLLAYCGECNHEIHDTKKHPVEGGMHIIEDIIKNHARKHREETGHDDLQVDMDRPKPSNDIEATINTKTRQ